MEPVVAAMNAPASKIPLRERLHALRRRRTPAMITAASLLVVVLLAAHLWPATYRAKGTILIEQQEVPADLVRSTISSYADQRIQVISQRVMTSENLLRIIDKYDLYADERKRSTREALIEQMHDDIKFSMISADVVDPRLGRPTKATIAFSVSFDSPIAATAAKVANELTTLYLNENLESRKQLVDDTASFLTGEADRLSAQIAALEQQLAEFKEQHVNSLPELKNMNLQFMSRAQEELRDVDSRIRSLDQQIVYLDAQIAQLTPVAQLYTSTGERVYSPSDRLKVLKSEYARVSAVYAADHPDVLRMKREIAGLESQAGTSSEDSNDRLRDLQNARAELDSARERYAADHPDVTRLNRLVASLQDLADASSHSASSDESDAGADNPVYIQVRSQREASSNEREALQHRRAALVRRIDDFEQRVSQSPEIERQYVGMLRELENAQLKYREVRQKQMEATLAKNLEAERKGERFTLIEPPFVPEEPVSPNRPAISVLGAVLAMGSGLGVVVLLEAFDQSVRSRRDLESVLTVAPLAVLPWIETAEERRTRALRRRYGVVGACVSALVVIGLVHLLYKPLDVIWHVALRKLGI